MLADAPGWLGARLARGRSARRLGPADPGRIDHVELGPADQVCWPTSAAATCRWLALSGGRELRARRLGHDHGPAGPPRADLRQHRRHPRGPHARGRARRGRPARRPPTLGERIAGVPLAGPGQLAAAPLPADRQALVAARADDRADGRRAGPDRVRLRRLDGQEPARAEQGEALEDRAAAAVGGPVPRRRVDDRDGRPRGRRDPVLGRRGSPPSTATTRSGSRSRTAT